MSNYGRIKISQLYNSIFSQLVRFFFSAFLIYSAIQIMGTGAFPKFPLFFLLLLFMVEIFMQHKVTNILPLHDVSVANDNTIYDVCAKEGLEVIVRSNNSKNLLKHLFSYKQVYFILERIGVSEKDIVVLDISLAQLVSYAIEVAKSAKGSYVTTMDLFVSYLLATEQKTKLLFSKELKDQDLLYILEWARLNFSREEHPEKFRVFFNQAGIGEGLMEGWTPETKNYTKPLPTVSSPLLRGREKEYQRLIEILQKRSANNVLLIGNSGIGKETLIQALGYESFVGQIKGALSHKKILELLVGPLIAGTINRNTLEARVQSIISEISHSGYVILYIPQFENVLGATNKEANISDTLLPYLQHDAMPIIATMTQDNFKLYMEKKSLKDVFEIIKLQEPDVLFALQMLFEKTLAIEKEYQVIFTYNAVVKAVDLSSTYLKDEVLPGSAATLLESVANNVLLSQDPYFDKTKRKLIIKEHVIKKLQEQITIPIDVPTQKEKEELLTLEDRIHIRVVDQAQAVSAIAEAVRRLRTGLSSPSKPISFLFLGPTGVGKTEAAKALASVYYGGEDKMLRFDMSEYTTDDGVKRLLGATPGEGEERGELTDKAHDHPNTLLLLDEFEKANPKILDLFLQVLEDGRLTDNKGQTVSFIDSIIIATSNAASEFIREEVEKGTPVDKEFQKRLISLLQEQRIFRPELLNRFDDIITFKPLSKDDIIKITKLLLEDVSKKLEEQDITLSYDESVLTKIATEGFDKQFGARPIRRFIQEKVEDMLSQKMLKNEIQRGSSLILILDSTGTITASIK